MDDNKELLECGHVESEHSDFTTGYGTDKDGNRSCYDCCALGDKKIMDETGKYTLYLVKRDDGRHVTNWPASLDYKVIDWNISNHNIAGRNGRIDVWFRDYQSKLWHGYQIGDYNDICHVKRIKGSKYGLK